MDEQRIPMDTTPSEPSLAELLQVRRDKLQELCDKGQDPFTQTVFERTALSSDIHANFEAMEGQTVRLAGRILSKRDMGKAFFSDLSDRPGKIQLYIKIDHLGEEAYASYKKLDIGDIIGVEGTVFRTRRGEVSVDIVSYVLLSKSLKPLPEKWHGLTDIDSRYRQRYVDLIVNQDVRKVFEMRSSILKIIRETLDSKGFIEVETPVLNTILGGATARPFVTHHNTLDLDMYMRIAPELYLKRLIVGGLEKVYEIGRVFRNEGMSPRHNPEFTLLELYEAYTDYHGMMDITEEIFTTCASKLLGTTELSYQGEAVSLTAPWKRITMIDSISEVTGADFNSVASFEDSVALAKSVGVHPGKTDDCWGKIVNLVFEEKVEPTLQNPTFICDYPVEVSPLAKRKADDPRLTERFEIFIIKREMGNAFSELNDPIDQKGRFMAQVKLREEGDDEAQMMDDDYIQALEYGLPPTGGLGIGIDRMIMLLTDAATIRDVLLFPTMKPL